MKSTHRNPWGHRRTIRLVGHDYCRPGAYFVTLCTFERQCILGEVVEGEMKRSAAGDLADSLWSEIPAHFPHVRLDQFVVMPNHVHGLLFFVEVERAVGAQHAMPKVCGSAAAAEPRIVGAQHAAPKVWGSAAAAEPRIVGAQHAAPFSGAAIAAENGATKDAPKTAQRKGAAVLRPYGQRPGLGVVAGSLGAVIRSFKAQVAQQLRAAGGDPNQPIWQRNYYERVIRCETELRRVREYILNNPLRWSLDQENPGRFGM